MEGNSTEIKDLGDSFLGLVAGRIGGRVAGCWRNRYILWTLRKAGRSLLCVYVPCGDLEFGRAVHEGFARPGKSRDVGGLSGEQS